MATTSRTLNPLHFEDLEPRRFEDLVRQLAYDFRDWRRLEATGRAGSDDGFDARGWEIVADHSIFPEVDDGEAGLAEPDAVVEPRVNDDRIWLIQCKRERRIGPSKMTAYLDQIPNEELRGLHGILIAAPCDISKTTRDRFRAWCAEKGVAEWNLWGRGEIEDLLFRPANDHLLFAYFGFSLHIRRRSLKSELRARLATKRRAGKLLGNHEFVLLRDPSEDRYPWLADGTQVDRSTRGRWRVAQVDRVRHDGVHVFLRRSSAYIGADGRSWDYAEASHSDRSGSALDPWLSETEKEEAWREMNDAKGRWSELPEDQRGYLEVVGVLPFDAIIAIDEDGDDVFEHPHIFTTEWRDGFPPFLGTISLLRGGELERWNPDEGDRVKFFRRIGDDRLVDSVDDAPQS